MRGVHLLVVAELLRAMVTRTGPRSDTATLSLRPEKDASRSPQQTSGGRNKPVIRGENKLAVSVLFMEIISWVVSHTELASPLQFPPARGLSCSSHHLCSRVPAPCAEESQLSKVAGCHDIRDGARAPAAQKSREELRLNTGLISTFN